MKEKIFVLFTGVVLPAILFGIGCLISERTDNWTTQWMALVGFAFTGFTLAFAMLQYACVNGTFDVDEKEEYDNEERNQAVNRGRKASSRDQRVQRRGSGRVA